MESAKQTKQVKFPNQDSTEECDLTKDDILGYRPDYDMVDAFLVNDTFENSFFNN